MAFADRTRNRYPVPALVALLAAAALSACGGGGSEASVGTSAQAAVADGTAQILSKRKDDSKDDSKDGGSQGPVGAQPANTEGRLLASNCFQCHGTLGTGGFDNIRGGEAKELAEFAAKAANRDIMAAHAQGYTPEQLQKIIAYLQQ